MLAQKRKRLKVDRRRVKVQIILPETRVKIRIIFLESHSTPEIKMLLMKRKMNQANLSKIQRNW